MSVSTCSNEKVRYEVPSLKVAVIWCVDIRCLCRVLTIDLCDLRNDCKKVIFSQIMDVMTLLGGDVGHVF